MKEEFIKDVWKSILEHGGNNQYRGVEGREPIIKNGLGLMFDKVVRSFNQQFDHMEEGQSFNAFTNGKNLVFKLVEIKEESINVEEIQEEVETNEEC